MANHPRNEPPEMVLTIGEIEQLQKENQKLREALEFYAELNHVQKGSYSELPHGEEWDMYHRMAIENGHKARQTLDEDDQ